MHIVFDENPIDAKPQKYLVVDRIRFALRRFARQVSSMRVSFTDLNGLCGGDGRGGLNRSPHPTAVQNHVVGMG